MPLLNSKRCFKASAQNCKIEAFKLVGEVAVNFQNFAPAQFQTMFCLYSSVNRQNSLAKLL
ncbi:hypothetical protein FUT84_09450 [Treponema phagedenis]|uniref:Uncharacterized protein n=1 Tax=Treponema phagedenis TaxID=162 RepID=A0A0B7GWQ3_TREPH|nr:hypothetical protein FUT79_09980 [Treponema phagedenis]QEJ97762.1 hypothetical protein FUT82_06970 [Treponema phagedenis]QEK01349.1 hypothetical protein FUT84_09450 [Treponema phagedenis]QEK03329.1 hypothetical protein FUT83_05580 [Treponema phagedenis]QEK06370.1 hypothetical protein FUT80_06385 [Treponema phagedenis]